MPCIVPIGRCCAPTWRPCRRWIRHAILARTEAYWINLYNALTVDPVLAHHPVKSIREIGGGWLFRGPWDDAIAKVAGRALSLNDIEHGVLRPV